MNDEQRIRERAYQIWEEEGQPEGKEAEHWRRAREEAEPGQPQSEPPTDSLESGATPPPNDFGRRY